MWLKLKVNISTLKIWIRSGSPNFKWFVRKNLSQVYPKACGLVNLRFCQVDSQEHPRHNSICRCDIWNTSLLYNPRRIERPIMHSTCPGTLETGYSNPWRQVTCSKPCRAIRTVLSKIFGSQLQWGGQNAGDLKYVVYSDRIYSFIHLVYNLLLFRRGMPCCTLYQWRWLHFSFNFRGS